MELERYTELLNELRRWRDIFAEDLRQQIEANKRLEVEARGLYDGEGIGEEFPSWLERFCRQLAIQFILKMLFIRVLEDRDLLKVKRIRTRDSQQLFQKLTRFLGATSFLRYVFRDVANLLPDLFAETEQDITWPADDLVDRFLEEVWRRKDVDREGWLRYDFRGRGERGFDTRFIGDLYQDIDQEAREHYALLQTPHFVSKLILENSLQIQFEEKDFREVTLLDPTCGSGHFLVDAFYMFMEKYLDVGEYKSSRDRATLASYVINNQLFGTDLNPFACSLARFRLLLASCDFAQVTDLAVHRNQRINVINCDSLIPYELEDTVYVQIGLTSSKEDLEEKLKQQFGSQEIIREAKTIFSKKYDVVVGNPPYIVPKDKRKRKLYRRFYPLSAKGKYGLSSPFIKRFLDLAQEGGSVALISSNAFSLRDFGKDLIEKVLPKYEIEMLIDTSGAYIPGHGTPTLILFMWNKPSKSKEVFVISSLAGEPEIPKKPSDGIVWKSILQALKQVGGFENDYVESLYLQRSIFNKHPWHFGGPINRLFEKIKKKNHSKLGDQTVYLGPGVATNYDDAFSTTLDYSRRIEVKVEHIKAYIHAVDIRDWIVKISDYVFFPYESKNGKMVVSDLTNDHPLLNHFRKFKENLINRPALPASYKWYEYTRKRGATYLHDPIPCYAEVTTTNHLAYIENPYVIQRSGRIIELKNRTSVNNKVLSGIINSSLVCFLWKRRCYNKKPGDDPYRDNYEFTPNCTYDTLIPLNLEDDIARNQKLLALVEEQIQLSNEANTLFAKKVFHKAGEAYQEWNSSIEGYIQPHAEIGSSFNSANELKSSKRHSINLLRDIRQRMIFLQEEMDWLVYEMYGIVSQPPLAMDYLDDFEYKNSTLELGQRSFEVSGNYYEGDWPKEWKIGSKDNLPGPAAHLPEISEGMDRLIRNRIDIIKSNDDIALLEDPLYKRRWIPQNYEAEFREALEWWIREMAEWELEQASRPININEWSRRLMQNERVRAALEVYTDTPDYDAIKTIEKIIQPEAVPDRPEHYMSASGLRKLARGEQEFKRADFSDGDAWKVRGKLNIPRERFIAYTSFEPGWYGWAGWDAEKRAEALVYLLSQAADQGWSIHHQQCGLRASLRSLVPQLEHLPIAEQQEFRGIAYMCGINEPCFCQAFRETEPNLRPPGFGKPSIKSAKKPIGDSQLALF